MHLWVGVPEGLQKPLRFATTLLRFPPLRGAVQNRQIVQRRGDIRKVGLGLAFASSRRIESAYRALSGQPARRARPHPDLRQAPLIATYSREGRRGREG